MGGKQDHFHDSVTNSPARVPPSWLEDKVIWSHARPENLTCLCSSGVKLRREMKCLSRIS